jgi:hypothetical protein
MCWILLPGMLILAACEHRAPPPPIEGDRGPAPPVLAPVLPTAIPSASETQAAILGRPGCPKPVVVPPRVLATGWPSLLGKRVRINVRAVRSIGMTEWLVVAGGQRFIVVGAPDTPWTVEHAFIVSGSAIAPLGGRTSLPELIIDDECDT